MSEDDLDENASDGVTVTPVPAAPSASMSTLDGLGSSPPSLSLSGASQSQSQSPSQSLSGVSQVVNDVLDDIVVNSAVETPTNSDAPVLSPLATSGTAPPPLNVTPSSGQTGISSPYAGAALTSAYAETLSNSPNPSAYMTQSQTDATIGNETPKAMHTSSEPTTTTTTNTVGSQEHISTSRERDSPLVTQETLSSNSPQSSISMDEVITTPASSFQQQPTLEQQEQLLQQQQTEGFLFQESPTKQPTTVQAPPPPTLHDDNPIASVDNSYDDDSSVDTSTDVSSSMEDPWEILRQTVQVRMKPRLICKVKKHLGKLGSADVVCDVTRARQLHRRNILVCKKNERRIFSTNARDPVEQLMRMHTGITTEAWSVQLKPPMWEPHTPPPRKSLVGKLWNLGRRTIRPWTWWRKLRWTPFDSEVEVQSIPLNLVGGLSLSCAATYDYVDRRGAIRWHATAGGQAKNVYVRSADNSRYGLRSAITAGSRGHGKDNGNNDGDSDDDDDDNDSASEASSIAGASFGIPYKRRLPPRAQGPRRIPLIPYVRHEVRIGFECDFEPPSFEGAAGTRSGHPMEPSSEQSWSLGQTSFALQQVKVVTHL